jgi:hypothetical protein
MAEQSRGASLIPGAEEKGLCPTCHKFYHLETGEIVPELAHISVANVTEKDRCKPCTLEKDVWL